MGQVANHPLLEGHTSPWIINNIHPAFYQQQERGREEQPLTHQNNQLATTNNSDGRCALPP